MLFNSVKVFFIMLYELHSIMFNRLIRLISQISQSRSSSNHNPLHNSTTLSSCSLQIRCKQDPGVGVGGSGPPAPLQLMPQAGCERHQQQWWRREHTAPRIHTPTGQGSNIAGRRREPLSGAHALRDEACKRSSAAGCASCLNTV